MREDSCIGCLFSEDDETTMMLNDMLDKHNMIHNSGMKCGHPSSPYYEELVFEDMSCRQYVNAREYFKMKDRQDNIDEIKEKIRRKKLGL